MSERLLSALGQNIVGAVDLDYNVTNEHWALEHCDLSKFIAIGVELFITVEDVGVKTFNNERKHCTLGARESMSIELN